MPRLFSQGDTLKVCVVGPKGSGKTVLCKIVVEEAVRCGIPVICIDPQGDLCSLAVEPERSSDELSDSALTTGFLDAVDEEIDTMPPDS